MRGKGREGGEGVVKLDGTVVWDCMAGEGDGR